MLSGLKSRGQRPLSGTSTRPPAALRSIITGKLKKFTKVAIVGLGGTGSYLLDLVAKTPVPEIHLYDGDVYLQHNAFRSPGAPSIEDLASKLPKVTWFKTLYSRMHAGILEHTVYIDEHNIEELRDMSFVFLCIDSGESKRLIVQRLEEFGVPFIDVGMGVQVSDEALGGIVRVTTSTPEKRDHFRQRVSLADRVGNNEYDRNIQVADLNALNAALAVMKWKKIAGFYRDMKSEHHSQFTIDGSLLINEDRAS